MDRSTVAVGYSRQSRTRLADIEAGRIVSPEMQLEQNRAYAKLKGFAWDEELTREAIEINTSGGQSKADKKKGESSWKKRRGLGILLEAAKAGRFQHLIVYKLSRLVRNAREGLEICDAFERLGVTIHSASEQIDYSTTTGRMIRTMMFSFAEMELENTREFVTEAIWSRAQSGKHHGPLPAWIAKAPEGQEGIGGTPYIFREPQASAMRRLVALRCSGLSYAQLARQMNAEGIPAPAGGLWSAHIASIQLDGAFRMRLMGFAVFGRGKEEGSDRHIITPGVFPPLLSEAEWEALESTQRILVATKQSPGIRPENRGSRKAASGDYLLTRAGRSLLICAVCGSGMVGSGGSRGYQFYGCLRAAEVPGAHPDTTDTLATEDGTPDKRTRTGAYITQDSLEEAVMRALGAIARDRGLDQVAAKGPKPKATAPKATASPRRTPAQLAQAEARIVDAFTDGDISGPRMREQLARLDAERSAWLEWEEAQRVASDAALGWETLGNLVRGQEISRPELRLMIQRLVATVEAPVTFEGLNVACTRNPSRWARVTLLDGTMAVAAIHHARYTGPRYVHLGEGIPEPPPWRAGVKKPGSKPRKSFS